EEGGRGQPVLERFHTGADGTALAAARRRRGRGGLPQGVQPGFPGTAEHGDTSGAGGMGSAWASSAPRSAPPRAPLLAQRHTAREKKLQKPPPAPVPARPDSNYLRQLWSIRGVGARRAPDPVEGVLAQAQDPGERQAVGSDEGMVGEGRGRPRTEP